jgi:predicted transport protein
MLLNTMPNHRREAVSCPRLLDHKADFELLTSKKLGAEKAVAIDWSLPCVICIANDFSKFDEHAVNQMKRNIKLFRYKKYRDDLILFEHLNPQNTKFIEDTVKTPSISPKGSTDKTFEETLSSCSLDMKNLYNSIHDYILSLGDDIEENQLKRYVAFKKIKNIICIDMTGRSININLRIDTEDQGVKQRIDGSLVRNMTRIGHWGTGDLQIVVKKSDDFEKGKSLIDMAYNLN